MQSVVLESWCRKEAESESRESVRLSSNAIDSPTSPQEETVLDCRSHCTPALPW